MALSANKSTRTSDELLFGWQVNNQAKNIDIPIPVPTTIPTPCNVSAIPLTCPPPTTHQNVQKPYNPLIHIPGAAGTKSYTVYQPVNAAAPQVVMIPFIITSHGYEPLVMPGGGIQVFPSSMAHLNNTSSSSNFCSHCIHPPHRPTPPPHTLTPAPPLTPVHPTPQTISTSPIHITPIPPRTTTRLPYRFHNMNAGGDAGSTMNKGSATKVSNNSKVNETTIKNKTSTSVASDDKEEKDDSEDDDIISKLFKKEKKYISRFTYLYDISTNYCILIFAFSHRQQFSSGVHANHKPLKEFQRMLNNQGKRHPIVTTSQSATIRQRKMVHSLVRYIQTILKTSKIALHRLHFSYTHMTFIIICMLK